MLGSQHSQSILTVTQPLIPVQGCVRILRPEARARAPNSPLPGSLGTHLQCDVGTRPVLQVSKLQVGVPIHKIDAKQLLTLRTTEAWQALAHRPAALVHTVGTILALSALTEVFGHRQPRRDLTKLSAVRKAQE